MKCELTATTPEGVPYWIFSVIPGLGQFCQARIRSGVLWWTAVFIAYGLSWKLGLCLHSLCLVDAFGARRLPILVTRKEPDHG